jgi:hypothetical protein
MQKFPIHDSHGRGTVVNPSDLDGSNMHTERNVVLWFTIKSKLL